MRKYAHPWGILTLVYFWYLMVKASSNSAPSTGHLTHLHLVNYYIFTRFSSMSLFLTDLAKKISVVICLRVIGHFITSSNVIGRVWKLPYIYIYNYKWGAYFFLLKHFWFFVTLFFFFFAWCHIKVNMIRISSEKRGTLSGVCILLYPLWSLDNAAYILAWFIIRA